MSRYAPLTAGLKHVTQLSELQPGEAYVARFKNALKHYRTDIWIGVIMPEGFEPGRGLSRRPKGSKPTGEGSVWTTPLSERVYPIFLPGRNSFRWTPISDLFILERKPPSIYAEGGRRPEGHLFRKLSKIAMSNPGLDFWKEMASKETQAKGKRGRELGLILPDDYEDIFDEASEENADESMPSEEESATGPAELGGGQVPASRALGSSNPHLSPIGVSSAGNVEGPETLRFPGESSSFLSYTQGGSPAQTGEKRSFGQASLGTDAANPAVPQPKQRVSRMQPSSSKRPDNSKKSGTTDGAPKMEDDAASGYENKGTLFELNLRTALEHVFLQEADANDILTIFNDSVSIQNKPEFDHARSWLKIREFVPRLVQVNDQAINPAGTQNPGPNDETSQQRQIGDIQGIHRKYHLEAVSDSEVLRESILSLGRLYHSVRHFTMDRLVDLITLKLQVAWNSYPGISQLRPILEVTAMAFSEPLLAQRDNLRTWLVAFIADTQDLYYYACAEQYWELMRGNRVLHDEICQKRTEMHRDHPERYADVRAMIRSRGIETC